TARRRRWWPHWRPALRPGRRRRRAATLRHDRCFLDLHGCRPSTVVSGLSSTAPLRSSRPTATRDCENGSCVPLAAIGQPCTSKCVPGAYCSPLYVCEAELADGQPCPEEERCASGNC